MKFIKTYHGEWINPALVKHFDVRRETCDKAYAWLDKFVAKLNEEK